MAQQPVSTTPSRPPQPSFFTQLRLLNDVKANYALGYHAAAQEFGDVVRFSVPRPTVLVSHPDLAREILKKRFEIYGRSRVWQQLRPLLGGGILISEGDTWRRQRKLMAPLFTPRHIRAGLPALDTTIRAHLDRWRGQREVDACEAFRHLTLILVGEFLFGQDMEDVSTTLGEAVHDASVRAAQRQMLPVLLPDVLPTPGWFRSRRALRTFRTTTERIVAERRARPTPTDPPDLLDRLLGAYDADPEAPEEELHSQILNLLLAGHDTTATTLAWATYLLAKHPEVQEAVRREALEQPLGSLDDAEAFDAHDLTHRVILETLRLYPPVAAMLRRSTRDDVLGDYRIDAGTEVVLGIYAMHRHPDFWEAPDVFDPERFVDRTRAGRQPEGYLPFGTGPNVCLGADMAVSEARLVLTRLVERFRFSLPDGFEVGSQPLVTLKPAGPVPLQLEPLPKD